MLIKIITADKNHAQINNNLYSTQIYTAITYFAFSIAIRLGEAGDRKNIFHFQFQIPFLAWQW